MKIRKGRITFPNHLSKSAKSLIKCILEPNEDLRMKTEDML